MNELAYGAMQIGAAAGNNLLSQAFAEHNRERQYYYNELMSQNADKRTRALYNDLYSPTAMLEQYKQAGLSPSQMFANGTGGVGAGQAGAQGNGVNAQAQYYGINPLELAQIELTKAEAKKANAEADTITGDNKRGLAEISNLVNQAGYTEAATNLIEQQKIYQEIENFINNKTKEFKIGIIENQCQEMEYQAGKAYWSMIKEETETQRKEIALQIEEATKKAAIEKVSLINKDLCTRIGLTIKEQDKIDMEILGILNKMSTDFIHVSNEKEYWKTIGEAQTKTAEAIERNTKIAEDLKPYEQAKAVSTIVNETIGVGLDIYSTIQTKGLLGKGTSKTIKEIVRTIRGKDNNVVKTITQTENTTKQ